MVETFAEQFDTAFTQGSYPIPLLPDNSRVQNSIETIHFTAEKIEEALKNMKRNSSPGPDNIPTVFLQNCSNSVSPLLSEVMQECLEQEKIPDT